MEIGHFTSRRNEKRGKPCLLVLMKLIDYLAKYSLT